MSASIIVKNCTKSHHVYSFINELDLMSVIMTTKCKLLWHEAKKLSQFTMPPNKKNPVHFISLYWPNFQSHNSHWHLMVIFITLSKSCSSWLHLHASFDTFWVQIDHLVKRSQDDRDREIQLSRSQKRDCDLRSFFSSISFLQVK